MTQGRPLEGRIVVVTRPREQAASLAEALEDLGAEVLLAPTIRIVPRMLDDEVVRVVVNDLPDYRLVIFTSVNGVAACGERLQQTGRPIPEVFGATRLAAIGPATAGALLACGLRADFVPQEYIAERILDGLGQVAGQRILLLRAELARPALAERLAASGARVDEIPVYQTLEPAADPAGLAALRGGVDGITFTSSSTVRNFVSLAGLEIGAAKVACIGPITAGTARELGLPVHVTAREYTIPGLVQALKEYFNGQE